MIRRTDNNHKKIMDQVRQIPHISIFSTHTLGKGFPDIVIGYKGRNYLFEIKNNELRKSQTKLTPDEQKFHTEWNGQIAIIYTIHDLIKILNAPLQ